MRHLFVALVISAAWSSTASARVVLYFHPHPIAPTVDGGMCHIEGPHVHSYRPHAKVLYTKVDRQYVFVGDPVEFDKKREKHAYYGHHPLFWVANDDGTLTADEYCFLTGPHYHWYAPPAELQFKREGGAYWYIGAHPGWYARRWMPRHRRLARHYGRVTVHRPTITVEPPSGFVGIYIGANGPRPFGVVGGGVRVHGPGVSVRGGVGLEVRVPGVGVSIGGGHRGMRRRGPPGHAPAWGYRGKRKHKYKYKKHRYKYKHRGYPKHGSRHGYRGKRGKKRGKRK